MKKIFVFLSLFLYCSHFTYASQIFDDVSRLNPTEVYKIVKVHEIQDIRDSLLEAKTKGLKISIAGKRHSQGGQQSCSNCIVLDMLEFNKIISLDAKNKIIRVQAGVTWDQIQRYINPFNLSLEVMQTSNIFTVGGSLSANVHGQDIRFGDIRNTIKSFRLLLADGNVVNVSREENPELFRLVIGGLGLFGVILDVDIILTDNEVYEANTKVLNDDAYVDYFKKEVQNDSNIRLHFAALSTAPGNSFLKEMIVTSYAKSQKSLSAWGLNEETNVFRDKLVLGLSRKYSWGKWLSWFLQKIVSKGSNNGQPISRNNAMRNPIKFLEYHSSKDTDILQEYFVPIDRWVEFLDGLREIVKNDKINLMYVGVRQVPADSQGYLSYAQQDSIATVFYINQGLSNEGKEKARKWTQDIVSLTLRCQGTYYLVYQLYPKGEQLRKAYPQIDEFFKKKRYYDPQQLFMNKFYQTYSQN